MNSQNLLLVLVRFKYMNIKDFLSKLIFYRQHPDTALRYLPIVLLLKRKKLENSKILEVGSGSYGISPYLKKEVIGLDTDFNEPEYPLLKQVVSSGEKIPFKDNFFDVVILSDVLEHIPKQKRDKVLNESIRVAKKSVIIGGPFGQLSFAQDQKLAEYSKKVIGQLHPFFKDHLKYGLPEVEEIEQILQKNSKVQKVNTVGQFLNLGVRELLMKFFITNNKLVFYFYLKGIMFLLPLLRNLNKRPCYRTIIDVKL
jgi:ubiquinone/menaquinone biosynthesis C-methylase UbiE